MGYKILKKQYNFGPNLNIEVGDNVYFQVIGSNGKVETIEISIDSWNNFIYHITSDYDLVKREKDENKSRTEQIEKLKEQVSILELKKKKQELEKELYE